MYQVKIISAGVKKIVKLEKLYIYQGPLCFTYQNDKEGFPMPLARLDNIESIEIVNDLSTRKVTTSSEGESVTKSKTGNMVKRGVVGGVLLGPAGAIIGGVTGTKNTEIISTSTSSETLDYLVTLQIKFRDGMVLTVSVDDPEITELFFSHIGVECTSDEELEKLKRRSVNRIKAEKEANVARSINAVKNARYEEQAKEKLQKYEPMTEQAYQNFAIVSSVIISLILCYFTHAELIFKLLTVIWFFIRFAFFTIVLMFPLMFLFLAIGDKSRKKYEKLWQEEIYKQKSLENEKKTTLQ